MYGRTPSWLHGFQICVADALSVLWPIILGSITGAAGEAERLRTRGRDIHLQTRPVVSSLQISPLREEWHKHSKHNSDALFSDRHGHERQSTEGWPRWERKPVLAEGQGQDSFLFR